MYFEELQYCTESGFDGVMINEHHNNPLCMMPSVNVIGSVLARTTKKGKIAFLGNVLPIHETFQRPPPAAGRLFTGMPQPLKELSAMQATAPRPPLSRAQIRQ